MLNRFIKYLTASKLVFPGIAIFLMTGMAFFSRVPVIDNTLSGYNLDNNPYQAMGERMMELFGSGNMVSVLVRPGTDQAQTLFSGLGKVEEEIMSAFPGTRVESLHKAERLLMLECGESATVREVLRAASAMPVLGSLVGKDTASLLMMVFPGKGENFNPSHFDTLLGGEFSGIHSMGSISQYHIQMEMGKGIARDFRILLPMIIFLVVAYLFYSYGSIRAVFYCLLHMGISLLTVTFFYSVTGININQITSTVLPVVIILSLSASVHLLTGYVHQPGSSPPTERIRESMRLYMVPSFLTVLTTVIAFASFVFSDSGTIRAFGLITAASVLTVFVLTYLVAPLFLRIAGLRSGEGIDHTFSIRFEKAVIRHNKTISILLIAVLGIAFFLIPKIVFKTNLETFLPRNTPVYHINKEIRENFHSLAEIDLLIEARLADPDSATKAGLFTLVRDFSRTIEGYHGVSAVQSFADQLEFERRHSLPGFRFVLFPRIRNPFVTQDREKYRINIKLTDPGEIWKVHDLINKGFHSYKDKYQLGIYSDFLFFNFINASVTRSLMKSLVLSGVLILVILFLLTRNFRVTAVTTLANLIPLGFLVVVMVLFRIEMSVAASMTLVVSLGVIVDDTIHILYRRIFLDRPLEELGFGVVTTSLILFAGFFSFILSSSLPNRTFGVLCALAFLVAIVSDLAVMSWLIREKAGHDPRSGLPQQHHH